MISDPKIDPLAKAARERQRQAHRPGTTAGRSSALKSFLHFCRRASINYKKPGYYHTCWYIEELANRGLTPGTISNHISHLRTYYRLAHLPVVHLNHYRVQLALKAVAANIRREVAKKEGVPPRVVQAALRANVGQENEHATTLAILIMYIGFLRQSSLAPITTTLFDHSRHLTNGDVSKTPLGIKLKLKWSKTIQRTTDAKVLILPPTSNKVLCPVRAFTRYKAKSPVASKNAPLLRYNDGNPITIRYMARRWEVLLKKVGIKPSLYSLHSLRKGGATFAYNEGGATLNDVMTQGTWRSLAVRDYIRPADGQLNSVHRALSAL